MNEDLFEVSEGDQAGDIFRARLEHDAGYGIDRRSGYSVCVNGHYLAELEPWLIVALWKAWRNWRAIRRDTGGLYP